MSILALQISTLMVALEAEAERFQRALARGDGHAVAVQRYRTLRSAILAHFRAHPGPISQFALVKALGTYATGVDSILADLKRSGYLTSRDGQGNAVYYKKTDNPCWNS